MFSPPTTSCSARSLPHINLTDRFDHIVKMGRVPAEIIAIIISHLAREGGSDSHNSDPPPPHALAPYATVSREWQQRVEAATFASITLTTARLASPLAAQALTPDRVRRFVRSVRIVVLLPPYGEQARGQREDEVDRAENDEAFTETVRRAFGLLATARTISGEQGGADDGGYETDHAGQQHQDQHSVATNYRPGIHLSITAECISDAEDLEARQYRHHVSAWRPNDIFEARWESSYLDLRPEHGGSVQDEAEALPQLASIQHFRVEAAAGDRLRYFAPRTLCLLASRMPGLENIEWELSDNDKRDVALRKRLRADFANTLPKLPACLQHFNLLYYRRAPLDHFFETPTILDNSDGGNDKLSLALHKLSQRLTTFQLVADVGPEIFWPSQQQQQQQQQQHQQVQPEDNPPLWPTLRDYIIEPGPIAPSGEWRFLPVPPSEDGVSVSSSDSDPPDDLPPGDERERPFRFGLDPDATDAFLLAAGRAARRMPMLRRMRFMLDPPIGEGLWVECEGAARDGTAELEVNTCSGYEPDEEVRRAWTEAAAEHTGDRSALSIVVRQPRAW